MLFKTGILMAIAASLLTLSGCQKIVPSTSSTIAATVNGTPISESLVDLIVKQKSESSAQPANPAMRGQIIDQLAMQAMVAQEAVKIGLNKSPEVVDQIDLSRQSILANAFVQNYFKSHPVNDDVLKAEYEKIKAQMGGVEYRARHILVANEADATDIIARLKKNPKNFDALAREKSMDSGSKENGGELGWFDPRNMVPEFGAALAKLTNGQFTDQPVKTRFGYHVILLEESRQKQAPAFDQVKPMLQQQMAQENLKKLLGDLKAKAKIEIAQSAAPAVSAGQAGNSTEPARK